MKKKKSARTLTIFLFFYPDSVVTEFWNFISISILLLLKVRIIHFFELPIHVFKNAVCILYGTSILVTLRIQSPIIITVVPLNYCYFVGLG